MLFSAPELISSLRITISSLPDNRTGANIRYSMEDIVLAAFSVFLTQSPSFLAFQRGMQDETGRNNGKSLFTMQSLPTDDQIRNVLDTIPPNSIFPVFNSCLDHMIETDGMNELKSDLGYLIALDGTQYFSSKSIHCKNCLTKADKKTKEVIYYHTAITPVVVKPEGEHVFSLVPEYIIPQDGREKQDCENVAAKRWLRTYGKRLSHIGKGIDTTILGDDLYSRQPVIETITGEGLGYILVCKRESHPWLYDWVDHLEEGAIHTQVNTKWNGKTHIKSTYRFANHVPLKDSSESLFVNWCEITVKSEETGKQLYHNAFITAYMITPENVGTITHSGRTRWKIENENNNTLKTRGYHFEHNFGHGEKYLSAILATLILLAFLFHTLFSIFWTPYIHLMERVKRQRLFDAIRTFTQYYYCPTWEHFFKGLEYALDHVVTMPLPFSILPAG